MNAMYLSVALILGSITSGVAIADMCCGGKDGDSCCANMAATTQPATQPSVTYVCPMKCATSDKPGNCPICGMKMVPQAGK